MCTLIALLQVVAGYPLVVAMNRDELYDRPSLPPQLRISPAKLVAPRDERAEGTWIGVNEDGVVAALSNRFNGTDPTARSRGLLCLESLAQPTAAKASMFASEAAEAHRYNGFNLLHGDALRVVCTSHGSGTWTVHGMRGANVLTNAGLNDANDPRAQRVRALLKGAPMGSLDVAVESLRRVLADHVDAGGRSICFHGERAGTRSQSIVAVGDAGWSGNRWWYAEGYPCTAKSIDFSNLFRYAPTE